MAKFKLGDQEIEGEYVKYTPTREDWNEYLVGDHVLRLKVVVSEVFKARDLRDLHGNPIFYIQSGNVLNVRKIEKD